MKRQVRYKLIPAQRDGKKIAFFAGMLVGGIVGVFIMALAAIAKIAKEDEHKNDE